MGAHGAAYGAGGQVGEKRVGSVGTGMPCVDDMGVWKGACDLVDMKRNWLLCWTACLPAPSDMADALDAIMQ